jgi:hypothetical protein
VGESTPRSKVCRGCSAIFVTCWPKQGFCTPKCGQDFRNAIGNAKRRAVNYPRLCDVCGATYKPARSDSLTCSRPCRVRLNIRRRTGADWRNAPSRECQWCCAQFIPTRNNRQTYCSTECWHYARDRRTRDSRPPTKCNDCQTSITGRGIRARFCPSCHARRRKIWAHTANSKRRARKRGLYTETVRRTDIAERDKWICQLCRKKVNRRLKHPHPLSASLDHVVPVSLGGEHSRANCQLAHLRCNCRKGARLRAPQQLALIG